MTTPWYDAPITQAHGVNGEQGIDLGTAYGTPITPLDPGTINAVQFGPFGGLVGEQTALGEEYFLHLDQVAATVGESVGPQDVIGLSGGQNMGGQHPASPAYSSGPHTEYGIFTGPLFASPALDPTSVINAARSGGIGGLGLPSIPNPVGDVAGAISNIPTQIGHGIANAIAAGITDVGAFFKRQIIALAVAVVVAIVLFA